MMAGRGGADHTEYCRQAVSAEDRRARPLTAERAGAELLRCRLPADAIARTLGLAEAEAGLLIRQLMEGGDTMHWP